ncbi:MAG: hypothetical protein ACR2OU_01740 [Thermomicrobiales bacterium]
MSRPSRRILLVSFAIVVVALAQAGTGISRAEHESTTHLTFERVQDSPSLGGEGTGVIDFRGGKEPTSRWTAMFRFTQLQPATHYVVVVQGRFGDDGTAEAKAFSSICAFNTEAKGAGGCWYYLVGMRRLGVVQVRIGDAEGLIVLQATGASSGPGSMRRTPNDFPPTATATPAS